MNISAPSITIQRAHLAFHDVVLFNNLQLTLAAGRCTCLLGPSGVGKTSLLRLIAGLITPATARHESISISADITCDNDKPLSQQIAYLGQNDLLLPWLTVHDNVVIGARLRQQSRAELRVLQQQAQDLLKAVGLGHALPYYPRQLSGGMRQRVALVRTLIENKPVVLLDEPFSALDTITRYQLQTLTATLLKGRTRLLITHDPLEALRLADDIQILAGKPAQLRTPLQLNTPTPRDPAEPVVLALQAQLLQELTEAYQETI